MTRRELIQRGLTLSLIAGVVGSARRTWGHQQALGVGQTLAGVEVDALTLTPQDYRKLQPILQSLKSGTTPQPGPTAGTPGTPGAGGGRRRRLGGAGGAGAVGGTAAAGSDQVALAKRALIALGVCLYEVHPGGESAESFRARLEKEIMAHELSPGVLWRIERMAADFARTHAAAPAGEATAPGPRRRPNGGAAPATGGSPDKASKELLRDAQKLILRVID